MAKVEYCDFCDVPLKEGKYYILHMVSASALPRYDNVEEYYEQVSKVEKEVKELCPTCKEVFDQIFKLRKERIGELADEIMGLYQKPTKNPPHNDKRSDKKKKKKKK
jgi:hypothetical protein